VEPQSTSKPNQDWYHVFAAHGIDDSYFEKWIANYEITTDAQKEAVNAQIMPCVGTSRPMVFIGLFGGGKTHIANAIVKNALMSRRSAYYYTMASMFRAYRTSLRDDDFPEKKFFERIFGCDVLAIDEMNVRSNSDAENRIIQEVVDKRYARRKQTIFIANMEFDEFSEMLGERLIDRLKEQEAAIVTFDWESYRGKTS